MIAFLNGAFVPLAEARISVLDRGFLYGDGLFETVRISNGRPFRWGAHLERLARGAEFLGIGLPFGPADLAAAAEDLARRNKLEAAVLRLTVSRGEGPRGYSARGAGVATVVMTLHPRSSDGSGQAPGWRLVTSPWRLVARDALSGFKHCNRLVHVMARTEAEVRGADEALLLNTRGEVAEASSGNLFWMEPEGLATPAEDTGLLPGITRGVVLELCATAGWPVREARAPLEEVRSRHGLFVCLSGLGIVPVTRLDGQEIGRDQRVEVLRRAHEALVAKECGRRPGEARI